MKRLWAISFAGVTLCLFLVGNLGAQAPALAKIVRGKADPELPFIDIVQVDKAPVIDGKLDDPCWQQAKKSSAFVDEYAFPVKTQTHFWICQKDDTIYLAMRAAYDPANPPKTTPTNTKIHDGDFWQGEAVEFFFDLDNETTPGYYQLALTPEGVTGDFFCSGPRESEARWEPKYQAEVNWTPKEWTAELALPLAMFDRTGTMYENFGFNAFRLYQGTSTWAINRGDGFHSSHKFGEARGLKGKEVKHNPTGLFRAPHVRLNERVIRAKAEPSLVRAKGELAAGPTVQAGNNQVAIGFKVNAFTDVAVWIENEKGVKVRHLAAGLLGPNPPQPLKKDSLEQSLTWDYKDDQGKRVPPGQYQVQVGAGTKANLERVLGHDPAPRHIQGIAVDGKGRLHVVGGIRDEWTEVTRYGRDGKFQGMVFPPPANVPPEKLVGFNVIDYGPDGQVRFGSHRTAAYLPHLDQPMPHTPLINSKGQVIIYGGEYQGGPTRFYKLNADGSLPPDFLGPYVKDFTWQQYFADWAKRFHFALDPADESVIYLSGLTEVHRAEYGEEGKIPRETWYNAVFRLRWGQEAPLEVFTGKRTTYGRAGGKEPGEFTDPQGICFDKAGNLWVCDRGNDRIQVFDKQGKFLRMLAHPRPYEIRISQKTGALYVLGMNKNQVTLAKYSGGENPIMAGEPVVLGKPYKGGGGIISYFWTMALDETGSKTELRIVRGDRTDAYQIDAIIDQGDSFSEPVRVLGENPPREYKRLAVSWDDAYVWAGGHWFDGKTGDYMGKHYEGEVAASRDGTWLTYGGFFPEAVSVFPSTWPQEKGVKPLHNWLLNPIALSRAGSRGFCVAPNGDVYLARYYQWQHQSSGRGGMEGSDLHVAIDHYAPDGKLLRRRVVYELSHGAASPAVDIKGNIYVTDNVGRKVGQFYEDDIAANLPDWIYRCPVDWDKIQRGEPIALGYDQFAHNPLIRSVGTLYKFGPEGGGILFRAAWGPYQQFMPDLDPKFPNGGKYLDWGYPFKPVPKRPATHWSATWVGPDRLAGMYPRWQEGVQWEFLGVSPVWGRYNKGHSSCVCGNSRISVDDFGRCFVPAAHRNTVRMIDTAGNEVLRIGRYGNLDAAGPGSLAPEVDIPLIFPGATALSRNYLYITEWRYGRILKVGLNFEGRGKAGLEVRD